MKKIKKTSVLVLTILFTLAFSISSYASTLTDFYGDSISGWEFKSSAHTHMGTTSTTYKFATTTVQTKYETDFNNGKAMWGSNISMSKVSSGNMGTVDAISDPNHYATAFVGSCTYNSTTNHYTGWNLTINSYYFDSNPSDGKRRTIAHELGHVYGLGHVTDSSKIMYHEYNTTKAVTSTDSWGMKVCTHAHSSHSSYSYTTYTNTNHKKRCGYCEGYFIEAHSFSGGTCTKCGYTQ